MARTPASVAVQPSALPLASLDTAASNSASFCCSLVTAAVIVVGVMVGVMVVGLKPSSVVTLVMA